MFVPPSVFTPIPSTDGKLSGFSELLIAQIQGNPQKMECHRRKCQRFKAFASLEAQQIRRIPSGLDAIYKASLKNPCHCNITGKNNSPLDIDEEERIAEELSDAAVLHNRRPTEYP